MQEGKMSYFLLTSTKSSPDFIRIRNVHAIFASKLWWADTKWLCRTFV